MSELTPPTGIPDVDDDSEAPVVSSKSDSGLKSELRRLARHYGGYTQDILEWAALRIEGLSGDSPPAHETTDARDASAYRLLRDTPSVKVVVEDGNMEVWYSGQQRSEWDALIAELSRSPQKASAPQPEPSVCSRCGGDYGSHTKDCAQNGPANEV